MKTSTLFVFTILLSIFFLTVESSLPDWWHLHSPFPKDYDDMTEGRVNQNRILRPMRISP
ncbi:Neuropeptide-Like Protein [Caenorhabditis elegans]|uniref:Neuropeptide-Like Protein n=2 Tax=Caenorhabditis elegans TaxID=6239 RepID=O01620_CAEEL|nr:Neuropeptide-Like Protein [Caenorhabditis elegans]CCD74294.1 Neuropeptide-Like Protein [Caenorhabditis elegans]|eukprot:NP_504028.1 Uncharacterized protein CELE_W08A12.2 [Caenorhabditis elegans]